MCPVLQEGQCCWDFTEKKNCWRKLLGIAEPIPPLCLRRGFFVKQKSHGPGALQELFSEKAERDLSPLKLVQ